jgi:hypothetical protein
VILCLCQELAIPEQVKISGALVLVHGEPRTIALLFAYNTMYSGVSIHIPPSYFVALGVQPQYVFGYKLRE